MILKCIRYITNEILLLLYLIKNNETRHVKWHETCKCKFRLDASVSNNNNVGIMINADVNVKY